REAREDQRKAAEDVDGAGEAADRQPVEQTRGRGIGGVFDRHGHGTSFGLRPSTCGSRSMAPAPSLPGNRKSATSNRKSEQGRRESTPHPAALKPAALPIKLRP